MLIQIRFVEKGEKYDKTVAKKERDCVSLAEALRWAAASLDRTAPESLDRVTSVRIRVVSPGMVGV